MCNMSLWATLLAGAALFLLGNTGKAPLLVNALWFVYFQIIIIVLVFWTKHLSEKISGLTSEYPSADTGTNIWRKIKEFGAVEARIAAARQAVLAQKTRQFGENLDLLLRATTDTLTGVSNREHLNVCMDNAMKTTSPFSVIIADIDYFKGVNDTFGHDAGDTVLKQFARLVRKSVRPSDRLFRFGGEEFIIITEAGIKEAKEIAERVREEISRTPINVGKDSSVCISASFGVAERRQGDTGKSLLKRADEALYRAKTGGRNRVCVERPDMSEKAPVFSDRESVPERDMLSEKGGIR